MRLKIKISKRTKYLVAFEKMLTKSEGRGSVAFVKTVKGMSD